MGLLWGFEALNRLVGGFLRDGLTEMVLLHLLRYRNEGFRGRLLYSRFSGGAAVNTAGANAAGGGESACELFEW
jgi:hypothetical protein